jgi:SAM-dependent methyltransferase
MFTLPVSPMGYLHDKFVLNRREKVLAKWFAQLLPKDVRVLDVGCGNGGIAALLQSKRPDIQIRGIEVLVRTDAQIPIEQFDGFHIPFKDSSFDVVLFADVLHHTENPNILLREARRVAIKFVLLKDHFLKGFAARVRLRLMDWVGNARFGVALPYHYWTERQWRASWCEIGLRPERLITQLGLYPLPANCVFGAELHFIALLGLCRPSNS